MRCFYLCFFFIFLIIVLCRDLFKEVTKNLLLTGVVNFDILIPDDNSNYLIVPDNGISRWLEVSKYAMSICPKANVSV